MAAKTFSDYDKDGSGAIEPKELVEALQDMGLNPSPKMTQTVIDRCDKNGDGKITEDEFTRLVGVFGEIAGLRQMFNEIDANEDGKMTAAELMAKSEKFYKGLTKDAAKDMVDFGDIDKDGTMSVDEFLEIMVDKKM
ncbi:calmodulin-4-like isoform X2 [Branchiostoma lanceolatum]